MSLSFVLLLKAASAGAKAILPAGVVATLKRRRARIDMGDLRRLEPLSRNFGAERGLPVDRYYIEQFLGQHRRDVRGRVLEIADATYTRQFGDGRVTHSDILHVQDNYPNATIVADLSRADHIESNTFDCIICTQTLMFIYDLPATARTLHRILKPGGVALVTIAGISQICRWDADQWGDYWRLTAMAAERLFGDAFGRENIGVQAYGNVLAATAFLNGMASTDFSNAELDHFDRNYQVLVAVRAVKRA